MVDECTDDADFNKKLAEAGKKPVIVDFSASWCGPCKLIAPHFEKLAETYAGKIICLKVDVDKCEATSEKYNIKSIPAFLVFQNEQVVKGETVSCNIPGLEALFKKWAQE